MCPNVFVCLTIAQKYVLIELLSIPEESRHVNVVVDSTYLFISISIDLSQVLPQIGVPISDINKNPNSVTARSGVSVSFPVSPLSDVK